MIHRLRTATMKLVVGALLGAATIAHATTMRPVDFNELVDSAEVVVSGHVASMQASWTAGHQGIYTDVTLNVERVLKGPLVPGQTLIVRTEGGNVDGTAMKVYGAATFAIGEEVVVFVERRGVARYVVAMSQGKMHVTTDATGQKTLHRNISGVSFTRPLTDQERAALSIDTVDKLETAVRKRAASRVTK